MISQTDGMKFLAKNIKIIINRLKPQSFKKAIKKSTNRQQT